MKTMALKLKELAWTDITAPTKEGLTQLSQETGIPLRPLLDCLDPELLPKYELFDDKTFIMLRVMLPQNAAKNASLEKITTKIGLFHTPQGLITVHRLDPDFFAEIRKSVNEKSGELDPKEFLKRLFSGVLASYDPMLTALEKRIDSFESLIFGEKKTDSLIKQGYLLRRRLSTMKKIIKMTIDVLAKIGSRSEMRWNDFQDLKDEAESNLFYADDDLENLNSLLNLHVALASHKTNEASYRTNEIMRLLTVFSIFFLPLNFIAGVYGMNFKFMPELDWKWGYAIVLGIMATVAGSLFYWMWARGWLARPEDDQRKAS